MKKLSLILIAFLVTVSSFGQDKNLTVLKVGSFSVKVKVTGSINITDSSIVLHTENNVTDVTFKIVNKFANSSIDTYQCTGLYSTSDKHTFVFYHEKNYASWNMLNSFSMEKVETWFTYSK